ncbi:MAG: Fe-S protein [Alphaproteobacteria bacterium]|nr:Fe-S protein [Alphaproteobacteria bacterium]
MLLRPRSHDRPFHLGPHALETLARDAGPIARESALPPATSTAPPPADTDALGRALARYRAVLAGFLKGEKAQTQAPLPADLALRAADLKGGAYFLDADGAGICALPENAWLADKSPPAHGHALVVLVEYPRRPEPGNPAHDWVGQDLTAAAADLRAVEIAACLSEYLRRLGFDARGHVAGQSLLDLDRLAVLAGLAVRAGERLVHPVIGADFALAAVSTDCALAVDLPLRADVARLGGLRQWWGIAGARSGRERARRARRATHLSPHAMERVKRVDRPTTLILDDQIPRVPKRAAFFQRAFHGDLGDKARRERTRFAFKTPFSFALLQIIRALVPLQDGPVATPAQAPKDDPAALARAVKSLSHLLGSDLTGICRVPRYAWFSHKEDGSPIAPYHRNAAVMLIDQGYDTMEGASGDDWISGAQSMRAYLRGALIAGVMGEFLRACGHPARAQTNADSDVLQIPLILWAGLGEMSRIGELVLNPFVGPRFKSVVLTTDLDLAPDRPIDFGLQRFCGECRKCARECPCDAIPAGGKVMFNGYETWKPDVERCTRYRLTNPKGSACGRCMKACPLNKTVDADGALAIRLWSRLGIAAGWLKPILVPVATRLDDWLGNGRINPIKRWWLDYELIAGKAVEPRGTNRRQLDPGRRLDPATQKLALFPAALMPPPDRQAAMPLARKAGLAAAERAESPEAARRRIQAGGAPPEDWRPTPPEGGAPTQAAIGNPYRR